MVREHFAHLRLSHNGDERIVERLAPDANPDAKLAERRFRADLDVRRAVAVELQRVEEEVLEELPHLGLVGKDP